jgi:hypothetical protein
VGPRAYKDAASPYTRGAPARRRRLASPCAAALLKLEPSNRIAATLTLRIRQFSFVSAAGERPSRFPSPPSTDSSLGPRSSLLWTPAPPMGRSSCPWPAGCLLFCLFGPKEEERSFSLNPLRDPVIIRFNIVPCKSCVKTPKSIRSLQPDPSQALL